MVETHNIIFNGDGLAEDNIRDIIRFWVEQDLKDSEVDSFKDADRNRSELVEWSKYNTAFREWVDDEVDDSYKGYLRDAGLTYKINGIFKELWKEDREFRESCENRLGEKGKNRESNEENKQKEDKNESSNGGDGVVDTYAKSTYPKLYKLGVVDNDARVNVPRFNGLFKAFLGDVDEVKCSGDSVERNDLVFAFLYWGSDRFGREWYNFVTKQVGPSKFDELVSNAVHSNDEISNLVKKKVTFNNGHIEGNLDTDELFSEVFEDYIDSENKREDERTSKINKKSKGDGDSHTIDSYARAHGSVDTSTEDGDEEDVEIPDIEFTGEDIIHGDSGKVIDAMVEQDVSIGAIITDPPYEMGYEGRGEVDKHEMIVGDEVGSGAMDLAERIVKKSRLILKSGSPVILFCNDYNRPKTNEILTRWYDFKQFVVWNKLWIGMGNSEVKWRNKHEYFGFATYGDPRFTNENRHDGDVLEFQRPGNDREHTTEKPVELLRYIIESVTDEGDIVFDPFAGSGSTLAAAKQTGRGYIGVEIDEDYYDYIVNERLAQSTLL